MPNNYTTYGDIVQDHYTPFMDLSGINSGVSESDLSSDIFTTFAHQFPYYAYNNPTPRTASRKRRRRKKDADAPAAASTVTPEAEKMTGTAPAATATPVTPTTPAATTASVTPEATTSAVIAQAFTPSYTTVNGKKVRDTATNKLNFIKTFLPVYRKVLKEKGISEDFAESLVAQAALESAWGYSPIGKHATVTNNYIGVKVPSKLKGKGKGQTVKTHEEVNGKLIAIDDEFMKFDSLEDMARHHIDLLSRNRYQAFSGGVNEFAQRVKNGGYATASNYVDALNGMIASVKKENTAKMHLGGTIQKHTSGGALTSYIDSYKNKSGVFVDKKTGKIKKVSGLPVIAATMIEPHDVPVEGYFPGNDVAYSNEISNSAIKRFVQQSDKDYKAKNGVIKPGHSTARGDILAFEESNPEASTVLQQIPGVNSVYQMLRSDGTAKDRQKIALALGSDAVDMVALGKLLKLKGPAKTFMGLSGQTAGRYGGHKAGEEIESTYGIETAPQAGVMAGGTLGNFVQLGGLLKKLKVFDDGGKIQKNAPNFLQRLEDSKKFRNFRMTLPPNLRPLSRDYNMRRYWELWGKPNGFYEALTERDGMFSYENDGVFHANTVGPENEKGEGEFMKSRNHPTLYYETDWYNKGITYDNNGKPIPLQGQERKDWEDFRNRYDLDTSRRFYKYVPRK